MKPSVSSECWILEGLEYKEFGPHSEYTGAPLGVFEPRSGFVLCFNRVAMVGIWPKER